MISADQPTVFDQANLTARVSEVADGDMSDGDDSSQPNYHHRLHLLDDCSIEMTQTTRIQVTYDDVTNFTRYYVADESYQGEGMIGDAPLHAADAMVVSRPNHALYLQLADCVGAVLYDPSSRILMVSHLGRQSTEQNGGAKSVEYLQQQFDCQPTDLQVWLSPAAGQINYPLTAFDGRGLHDIVIEQLINAGVAAANIETSQIDTTTSDNYFSHSQFVAGKRDSDGRFAIVAMMRD